MSPKRRVTRTANKVSIDGLADAVAEAMQEYADATAEGIKKAASEAADSCVKELRSTSPKLTGDYRKGWKKKKSFENATSVRQTVHNATDYQLTHPLEKGHAKRGGGRVQAIPHIEPAEQKAISEFERKAKEACQQ